MEFEYNAEQIKNLLNEFYTITKIKTVLYDSNFRVIAAVPFEESPFCAALGRVQETRLKCDKCTKEGLALCRQKNSLVVYTCHAGLIEAVAPIRNGDIILGYIMLGQVLSLSDSSNKKKEIISYASHYIGSSAKGYFKMLHAKTNDEIRAATKIMESCVCYFLMNKIIGQRQGNTVFELCRYIEQNPAADLTADALCSRFKISRNILYKISNTYFGMPLAAYVRNKRLIFAKKLIEEGTSVTHAAQQAGFYDYGYFGKIFKRYMGNTPSRVRK